MEVGYFNAVGYIATHLPAQGWVLHGSSSRECPTQLIFTSIESFALSLSQNLVLNLLPAPHSSVQLPHSDHGDQVMLTVSLAVSRLK